MSKKYLLRFLERILNNSSESNICIYMVFQDNARVEAIVLQTNSQILACLMGRKDMVVVLVPALEYCQSLTACAGQQSNFFLSLHEAIIGL